MFDDDDDDDEECLPIPRRSLIRHQHRKQISSDNDNENSPCEHRQASRISLNNSINLDESLPTPKQLIDLYEKTLDLASKNQITIRNAFQIPLVERLPEVLNLVAFDDQSHTDPNFIKVGSIIDTSAKIYGLPVDALHSETQRLSGSIQIQIIEEQEKKLIKKSNQHNNKIKTNSFLVTDLSTISLSNEFQFHPLQPSNMCHWSGGIGSDTIYADMVSYTMYSSSDFEYIENDHLLELTMKTMFDLSSLREVIKENEGENHILGCQNLREFSFNEESTESYIETIDECSLVDSSNHDEDEDQYAISDLRDEPMSFYHPDLQSTYTCPLTMPSVDISRFSFVDHVPFLLREKTKPSDYTYFDPIKLRLFAGPYVWKYTNLLPDHIKQPSIIRHQQSTTTKSIRNLRIDFFTTKTLDKLMSINTRSRQINKKFKQTNIFHQLRLTRRVTSTNDLIQLNHFSNVIFDDYEMDIDDNENYIPDVIDKPFEYDFIRPIHYEKIECEKSLTRIDTKKLQQNLFHQYEEEENQSSTISFSNLCLNLIDKHQLSYEKIELISAFYCMLNNCHKNNLFMKTNSQQDDLIIQNQPFHTPTFQLTYTQQISK